MQVYPNPDSWDEFYPSEIFIAVADTDPQNEPVNVFKKANIGATIFEGQPVGDRGMETKIYKKVGEIEALADFQTSLVLLGVVDDSSGAN